MIILPMFKHLLSETLINVKHYLKSYSSVLMATVMTVVITRCFTAIAYYFVENPEGVNQESHRNTSILLNPNPIFPML